MDGALGWFGKVGKEAWRDRGVGAWDANQP